MDPLNNTEQDSHKKVQRELPDKSFFTIFIFPFKYFKHKPSASVDIPPADLKDLLCGEPDSPWAIQDFWSPGEDLIEHYNQWQYFHSYVRNMIFSNDQEKKAPDRCQNMLYLVRKDYDTLSVDYYIEDRSGIRSKTMIVDVKSIDLHLFDNQIGFLTITTEKKPETEYELEELLKFNDITRRVYPPHLSPDGASNTEYPKIHSRVIPDRLKLFNSRDKRDKILEECFPSFNIPDDVPYLSKIISRLLSPLAQAPRKGLVSGKCYFTSFMDDRMFIVSHLVDKGLARRLSGICCGAYEYETSDDWYKLIFVDGEWPTIANGAMKSELIRKHTYARWANFGTLFGISRYSFVMLHDGSQTYLYNHAKGVYYQLALIVLFQRAMLLKFSEEIKELTKYFRQGVKADKEFRAKADNLHGRFIKFTNEYWYTEVTPQEQGIEIYRQWTTLMEHDYLFAKVKSEISELAVHVRTIVEHESNQNIEWITNMGLPLSVLITLWTVWLAVYGERHFPDILSFLRLRVDPWQTVLFCAFVLAGFVFIWQFVNFAIRWVNRMARRVGRFLRQSLKGKTSSDRAS